LPTCWWGLRHSKNFWLIIFILKVLAQNKKEYVGKVSRLFTQVDCRLGAQWGERESLYFHLQKSQLWVKQKGTEIPGHRVRPWPWSFITIK
jgi:hypothetical protein